MDWPDWMNAQIGGNALWRIAAFFLVLLAFLAAGRLARVHLLRAAQRRREQGRRVWPTLLESVGRSIGFLLAAVGLIQAFRFLILPPQLEPVAAAVTGVAMTFAIGHLVYRSVDVADAALRRRAERSDNRLDDLLVTMTRKSLRATVVVLTIIQAVQMLSDKPLTSIVAGLGVGSLAVALAGQDSIKNFFGSLIILADKPFELGQLITVEPHTGIVESVGMRSTRLRTFDGHLITFPNGELANRVITNISRRPFIRRVLNLALPYDTPPEKVQRATEIVRELLADHEGMDPARPPRIFFNEFSATALNLMVIYWYQPPDFFKYMAFSERFNLELLRRFNAEGIEFAFPTQTLFLAPDPKRGATPALGGPSARNPVV